ncbi:insulinase family protein [Anaerofustis sp.]|uniref:insulinase family protein n=1 Tax=Anaerofustis sp. TaxID=1872517 RepID=UPI0025C1AC22|nr:insulinase family protein [Anaerofustis sp.]
MKLKQNEKYSNFLLKNVENIKEINSISYEFEHIKSGARLLFIDNDDENKVFSISFRTPPVDNTGSAHILEHSVLCGSKKYPLKEPFVELMKSSLNTFLNAMTFSDKTMYPVASMNEADFRNLMDVYLDAVFNPLIYDKKEILEQEGWHYHLENKDDDIKYNGVVYNEMKGAFSDPEDILARNIEANLYKDTPYSFESGGDPKYIPDLTYDTFLDFHKRYYHPCNSYIYIYGKTDILRHLEYLDKNYLEKYDKIKVDSSITEQIDFSGIEKKVEKFYSVNSSENIDKKYLLSLNYSVGNVLDVKLGLILGILCKILFDSDSSYLKKALIEADIADEVMLDYNNGILQPVLSISAKNAKKDKIDLFKEVVESTFENIVKNGIDDDIIKAAINNFEFELKEGDSGTYPKGLLYGITVMESWLYDGDPTLLLKYENALEEIKKESLQGLFENTIKEYILNNEKYNYVILSPKENLSDKDDKILYDKLKSYKESLSEDEKEKLVEATNNLLKMQRTPDGEDVKALIPRISVSDIDVNPPIVNDVEIKHCGVNDIYIRTDETKDITYMDVNFEVSLNGDEEIHALSLLTKCFENFNTKNYDILSLNNEINENLGDIVFSVSPYQSFENHDDFRSFLTCSIKAFSKKEDKMYAIMEEMILRSDFKDKSKLRDIVREELSKMQSRIMSATHRTVLNEMLAFSNRKSRFVTLLNGISYYDFLKNLNENFDKSADKIISVFENLTNRIINSRKDIILTVSEDSKNQSLKNASAFLDKYESSNDTKIIFNYEYNADNTAIILPSMVNYVGQGGEYGSFGYSYEGSLLVLKKYLSTEYLWDNVRVMGGAYGSFIHIDKFGNLGLVSYRDPNVKRTYKMYDNLVEYIKNIELNNEEISKLIIGTVSDMDIPLNNYSKIREYVTRVYTKDTYENIKKRRKEVFGS